MKILEFSRNVFVELYQYLKRKENRLAAALFLAAVGGLAVYTIIRTADPANPTDFGNHFYNATRDIFYRGESIFGKYNYNSYSPLFYCIISFFAIFTKPVAALLWYILSVTVTIVTIGLTADMVRRELQQKKANIILPLLAVFFVIADNLYLGQSNFLPLFFMVLAFHYDQNGKEVPAGVHLGIAIALKTTPALLLLYFLIERKWMTILFAVISFFVSVYLVPGFFYGFRENFILTSEWFGRVIFPFITGQRLLTDTVTYSNLNQSLEAVLFRYLTPFGADNYRGIFSWLNINLNLFEMGILVKTLKLAVIIALAAFHILFYKKKNLVASFYIYGMLLISPASWTNHYYILLFPYIILLNYILFKWKGKMRQAGIIAFISGIALTFLSVTAYLQAMGFLFFGNLVIFTVIYVTLMVVQLPLENQKTRKKA